MGTLTYSSKNTSRDEILIWICSSLSLQIGPKLFSMSRGIFPVLIYTMLYKLAGNIKILGLGNTVVLLFVNPDKLQVETTNALLQCST